MLPLRYVYVMCLLVLIPSVEARISEIMYNPEGSDNDKEYVEIIFTTATTMQDWVIQDSASSDVLTLIAGSGESAINLIVEDGFLVTTIDSSVSVYTAGAKIGNGLNNNGDSLSVYDATQTFLFDAQYDGSVGNGDGLAVCFRDETAFACEPSPGANNRQEPQQDDDDLPPNTQDQDYQPKDAEEEGFLTITSVQNDAPLDFCEPITIELMVHNHQTTPKKVYAWIRGFNKKSSVTIPPQRTQQVILPVIACDEEKQPGEYVLVVEGFGYETQQIIQLSMEPEEKNNTLNSPVLLKEPVKVQKERDIKPSLPKESKQVVYEAQTGMEIKIMYYLGILVAVLVLYYVMRK